MIYSIIQELASTPSRNDKIAILNKHKDNALLQRVISLALNPFIQFYIRKIPAYKTDLANTDQLDVSLNLLDSLSSRSVTGNDAIEFLKNILTHSDENDAKVIELIIAKDLKCGVAASTVNKVWDKIISEFPCMLCSKKDEKSLKNIKFPAFSQKKSDGARSVAIVRDGKVAFHSRTGRPIEVSKTLEDEILSMQDSYPFGNFVVDGELLVRAGSIDESRKVGNGIINQALKGTISDADKERIGFDVWDIIGLGDFEYGESVVQYEDRLSDLAKCVQGLTKVKLIESKIVNSLDDAYDDFNIYSSQGFEGTILKNLHSPWEDKRSKHYVKFKNEFECELKIVGVAEGTGKYVGMLGALECKSSDGLVTVSVGTGFSDELRSEYFSDEMISKIVTIKYNEKIQSKNGDYSLFLPVFIKIREDKTVADSSLEIE